MDKLEELKLVLQNLKKNPSRQYSEEYISKTKKVTEDIWNKILKTCEEDEVKEIQILYLEIRNKIIELLIPKQEKTITKEMAKFEIPVAAKLISEFNGESKNLSNFLGLIEFYNDTLGEEIEKKKLIKFVIATKVCDKVRNRLLTLENQTEVFPDFKKALTEIYKPKTNPLKIHSELARLHQGSLEINRFAEKIELLISQLNEIQIAEQGESNRKVIIKLNDQLGLNAFKNGLNEATRQVIQASRITTFNEAIKIATEVEVSSRQNNVMQFRTNFRGRHQYNNSYHRFDNNNRYNNNNRQYNNNSYSNSYERNNSNNRGSARGRGNARGYHNNNTRSENIGIPGQQNRGNQRRY